jgi:hypothetical protein
MGCTQRRTGRGHVGGERHFGATIETGSHHHMTSLSLSRRSLLKFAAAWTVAPDSGLAHFKHDSIVDLMPAFWRVYDPIARAPIEQQAAGLWQDFFKPQEALFARAGIRHVDTKKIQDWLVKVAPLIPAMRRLHRRFIEEFDAYLNRFLETFADFDKAAAPTFLMPSLLHFDAHLEPSNGQLPLFFGIDGIVQFHGDNANLSVLFAHETYHCYQAQKNPTVMMAASTPLFAGLWIEGGATWVSERLNPQASLLNVLLDDQALVAITQSQVSSLAQAFQKKFDSTEDADAASFFSAGWSGPWPARSGYLLGLHIARRFAPSRSATQFASLSLQDVRTLYAPRIAAIASSGNLDA